jgi:hypothetical protein
MANRPVCTNPNSILTRNVMEFTHLVRATSVLLDSSPAVGILASPTTVKVGNPFGLRTVESYSDGGSRGHQECLYPISRAFHLLFFVDP